MEIVSVDKSNIYFLQYFIDNMGRASGSFRYYKTRPIEIINNHLTTLLIFENGLPVTYGHLDIENEIVWLGICVLPGYFRKGYGNIMMQELIRVAKESKYLKIYLSVDKNMSAINLYETFGFSKQKEFENSYKYCLDFLSK